ncbi:hypothetical protein K493DRAFT_308551 [Basidiobolus meristosporus CBS 931.73]|uniref:histidine kinase n=1 Tax=Basidiobolus meristosporus CBS 931.73 TaxID=1314790 RepID=A0A1Y1X0K8_9FUNG|nr:hypothetical protein K493DRAFT_308551 [Basidiobolus meristosporus CBS 931.73]|eukprot:ORX79349.1 hypothetical protein K493DRAFT_308551 [Basidiobolus meristosporus CBS 931.73]
MTVPTPQSPCKFTLEDYLSCLSSPALLLHYSPAHTETAPPTITIQYANEYLLNLCGVKNLSKISNQLRDFIFPANEGQFLSWLQRVNSNQASDNETYTIQINDRQLDSIHHSNSSKKNNEMVIGQVELRWSGVSIKNEAIVLTGIVVTRESPSSIASELENTSSEESTEAEHTEIIESEVELDDWQSIPQMTNPRVLIKLATMLSGGGVMGEMLRNYDWSSSPLGPVTKWPQSLLTAVSLCMASTLPMAVWWGPQFTIIYNDAYHGVAGQKHPSMFGKEGPVHWAELWDDVGPLAHLAMQGTNSYVEDNLLFMTRKGYLEETYITWSYIPVRQEDGTVGGFLNPYIEVTERILAERRLKTLKDINADAAVAKDTREMLSSIGTVLSENPYDIPFAALYTHILPDDEEMEESYDNVSSTTTKSDTLHLTQTIGMPEEHPSMFPIIRLAPSFHANILQDAVRLAYESKQSVKIELGEWFGEVPIRGWDAAATQAVVSPITGSNKDGVLGVIVMGINARREYDENYETFVDLVCRQTGSAIINISAYEEEVRRFKELAAIDRAKTAFFSSVSHELRTPLTLILGPVKDLLLERDLAKETRTKLTYMNRNAERLLRLVNLLLDFSKIEAGKMQATFQETNLGKFTADLASMFRSAIEKGGVRFEVDCERMERNVWVDRDMWEKIVFNLIGNAFKFTMKGSITVKLASSEDDRQAILSVADTGDGIPSHEIMRVFERFHRVEGRKGRSHEGTGIGLALTQELAKLHGGTVGVTSEFGKGSVFTVHIPFGCSHLPKDRLITASMEQVNEVEVEVDMPSRYGRSIVDEARHWLPQSDEDSTEYHSNTSSTDSNAGGSITFPVVSRGCRVLLADDNVDMRKYIKSILEKWWRVTEAEDGEQAYQMAIADPPDLIVSDVMMPNLDGYGLLKLLRTQPLTKFVPVILLSAQAGEEARVDGLSAGADDYLVKPFSAKELVARVHTHLELGKLRVELERMVKERTKELIASEARYKTLTKLSPVGIFRTDLEGNVTYTNDKWWSISGHNREMDPSAVDFLSSVHPDDREHVDRIWKEAQRAQVSSAVEFRWKWANGETRWCFNEMILQHDNEMKPCGFVGALTDLTERKRLEQERLSAVRLAEQQQRHRAEEAEEVKRQQELYIDMTCHELRNPLNGIYHSADLLHESLEKVQKEVRKESIAKVANWLEKEIEDDLDVVDTITLCAQHQKVGFYSMDEDGDDSTRMSTNDVLHMSKINMNLLVLSKTKLRPVEVVTNVIRMFETEVRLKEIDLKLVLAEGYTRMKVDWVKGDPTRFTQILINFMTNAIRFTERVPFRQVVVTLDASDRVPSQPVIESPAMETVRQTGDTISEDDVGCKINHSTKIKAERELPMVGSDSGDGGKAYFGAEGNRPAVAHPDALYIAVAIKDSGVGMTTDEQANLFKRFAQATPRTYAEFGGSGLGLFISKRLVELHDGKITVRSKKGDGTTFTFYLKCDRVDDIEEGKAEGCVGVGSSPNAAEMMYTEPHKPPVNNLPTTEEQKSKPKKKATALKAKKKGSKARDEKLVCTKERLDSSVWRRSNDMESNPRTGLESKCHTKSQGISVGTSYSILVVEDNLINQRVLKRQLELAGFSVGVAKHGAEALEVMSKVSYHLILMDLEMPVMGGLECTQRIRELEKSAGEQQVPIIGVSGNAREEYRRLALASGMTDYVIKPYDKQALISLINSFLASIVPI